MYKRIFAFGCSMTKYRWPTWADIYASDKTTEFYNYAHSAAGNQFIANQVVEASQRFKWDDDDLVLVMWSGITREDRYLANNHIVLNPVDDSQPRIEYWPNKYLPDNGGWMHVPVKVQYDDIAGKGFLIRDLATVKLTETFLSNFKYKMFQMTPFESEGDGEVYEIYDKPNYPCLLESVGGEWPHIKCTYDDSHDSDRHPDPKMHFEFLEYAGVSTTDNMREFTNKWQERVDNCSTHDQVNWDDTYLTEKGWIERL
tara:strand:+ start:5667 stop:6434 length:768 start_codon:yes stop_codon:yes gene_type:complete